MLDVHTFPKFCFTVSLVRNLLLLVNKAEDFILGIKINCFTVQNNSGLHQQSLLSQEILGLKKAITNRHIQNNIKQSNYKAGSMMGSIFQSLHRGKFWACTSRTLIEEITQRPYAKIPFSIS